MKIGYIRVSTEDQNLGRQEEAMKALGVERIYSDKASGKTMAREQYQAMRPNFVRETSSISMPWIASAGTIPRSSANGVGSQKWPMRHRLSEPVVHEHHRVQEDGRLGQAYGSHRPEL
jgi:hypothetical protein